MAARRSTRKKHKAGKARFNVEAGRMIYLDGEPYIGVTREGHTAPVDADEVTRRIARLLNKTRVKNFKRDYRRES